MLLSLHIQNIVWFLHKKTDFHILWSFVSPRWIYIHISPSPWCKNNHLNVNQNWSQFQFPPNADPQFKPFSTNKSRRTKGGLGLLCIKLHFHCNTTTGQRRPKSSPNSIKTQIRIRKKNVQIWQQIDSPFYTFYQLGIDPLIKRKKQALT